MWVKTTPEKATVQNGRPMTRESEADDPPDGEMLLYWVEMGILHINPNRTEIWRWKIDVEGNIETKEGK